jgi:cell division protein FtsN
MDHIHPSNNSRVAILLFVLVAVVTFLYIRFFATYQSSVPISQPETQQVINNMLPTSAPTDDLAELTQQLTSRSGEFSVSYPATWTIVEEAGRQESANGVLIQSWTLQNTTQTTEAEASPAANQENSLNEGTVRMQVQLYESEDGSNFYNSIFSCDNTESIECTKETINGVTFSKITQETSSRDLQINYGTIQNGVFYLFSSSLISANAALEEQVQNVVGTTQIRTQN